MKPIPYVDAHLKKLQDLVKEEMEFYGATIGKPTLRNFADWLVEDMPKKDGEIMSHATIINWRNHGKPPSTDFFETMLSVYPVSDRRFIFALKVLAVKSPNVWRADGVVWKLKDQIGKLSKAE